MGCVESSVVEDDVPIGKCSHDRRVVFSEFIRLGTIPSRDDLEDEIKDIYWSRQDYEEIKANQQRLVAAVVKQIEMRCLVGIEGESRRGLGLVCEPSNPKSRVTQRLVAIQTVLGAQKMKMSNERRAALLIEDTSTWAANNAYENGLKDAKAVSPYNNGLPSQKRRNEDHLIGIDPILKMHNERGVKELNQTSTQLLDQTSHNSTWSSNHSQSRTPCSSTHSTYSFDPDNFGSICSFPTQIVRLVEDTYVCDEGHSSLTRFPSGEDDCHINPEGLGLGSMIRRDSLTCLHHFSEEEDSKEEECAPSSPTDNTYSPAIVNKGRLTMDPEIFKFAGSPGEHLPPR